MYKLAPQVLQFEGHVHIRYQNGKYLLSNSLYISAAYTYHKYIQNNENKPILQSPNFKQK